MVKITSLWMKTVLPEMSRSSKLNDGMLLISQGVQSGAKSTREMFFDIWTQVGATANNPFFALGGEGSGMPLPRFPFILCTCKAKSFVPSESVAAAAFNLIQRKTIVIDRSKMSLRQKNPKVT